VVMSVSAQERLREIFSSQVACPCGFYRHSWLILDVQLLAKRQRV
jgi:hypothetical protein